MDIVTGKASPVQMFMEGRFKVEGNLSLLMKMWQLFRAL
jgi:putative sterol carrier protein